MRVGPASIRMPAPTIRLRLTLLYGLVFLVTGAVLLTIGYELVRHNLNGPSDYRNELRKLGLTPQFFGRPPGFTAGRPRRGSPRRSGLSSAPTRSTGC